MLERTRNARTLGGLLCTTLLLTLLPLSAAQSSTLNAAGRVVAIGDVHGEIEGVKGILREAGLIDVDGNWSGGNTTLVQTGDLVDRGAGVRQVMDLFMRLQRQAPEQGGEVIVLMGNHESINLLGDFQDASPEILASFAGEDSEKQRQKAWKEFGQWRSRLIRSRGGEPQRLGKDKKDQFMQEHPAGYFEYMRAMGPDGDYGKWLLSLPIMAKIGDTVFMHAGIGPEYADKSIDEINELHRREFEIYLENRQQLIEDDIIPWFYNLYETNQALVFQAENPPVEEYRDSKQTALITKAAEDLNRMQAILLQGSPLWYRGYTNLTDEELEQHLDTLKQTYGAQRFVVAHSPMSTGSIHERLGGRVFLIDTGMLSSYYKGRPSALEFQGGRISALYEGGERQVLVEQPDEMVPASAAKSSASLADGRFRRAVYRKGQSGRFMLAAYPPQEDGGADADERVWRDPLGNPLPFKSIAEMENFLATAEVKSQQAIPKGVTKPKKILLEKDGVQAHAKFNYVDKSGQREKMADGTVEMYFLDSYKADMAAYELSHLLGMESIPPAVARSIDGQDGIVQLWVEGLNTYENWLKEGNKGTPASTSFDRQLKDMYAWDLLIRNTDRNQGNIAWDQDTNLWLIDHTRSMARDPGLREPDKFKGCSRQFFQGIQALTEAQVTEALSPYLGSFEIKALMKRRDKLVKLINAEIKKDGEDKVLFNYGDPPPGLVISYD